MNVVELTGAAARASALVGHIALAWGRTSDKRFFVFQGLGLRTVRDAFTATHPTIRFFDTKSQAKKYINTVMNRSVQYEYYPAEYEQFRRSVVASVDSKGSVRDIGYQPRLFDELD